MPKFKVEVTLTKSATYQVEVEASGDLEAEQIAFAMWRGQVSDCFQVDKPDTFDAEAEQLTFACNECETEIFKGQSGFQDEMCPRCAAAYEATEQLAAAIR